VMVCQFCASLSLFSNCDNPIALMSVWKIDLVEANFIGNVYFENITKEVQSK